MDSHIQFYNNILAFLKGLLLITPALFLTRVNICSNLKLRLNLKQYTHKTPTSFKLYLTKPKLSFYLDIEYHSRGAGACVCTCSELNGKPEACSALMCAAITIQCLTVLAVVDLAAGVRSGSDSLQSWPR